MKQQKYMSEEEKIKLVEKQDGATLLGAFESIARMNQVYNADLEILRKELLKRLREADHGKS